MFVTDGMRISNPSQEDSHQRYITITIALHASVLFSNLSFTALEILNWMYLYAYPF